MWVLREFFLNNIHEKIEVFNDSLLSVFQVHTSLKILKITKPNAPWTTHKIKEIMKVPAPIRYKSSKHD